jgi:hypothetical protein
MRFVGCSRRPDVTTGFRAVPPEEERVTVRSCTAAFFTVHLLASTAGCASVARQSPRATQDAAYAWTPGDTLRYRKHSEWSSSYGLAGMPQSNGSRNRRDSRVAIAFTGNGRATGWFESIQFEVRGGNEPELRVVGSDVVGAPFVLAVGPRGSDSVVSRPRLPREWSDLENQFNGFFPRLPGGPLTMGREWNDSGSDLVEDSTRATTNTRDVTYRVAGTRRMRGVSVVVVTYEARYVTDERSKRMPPPGMDPYLMPSAVMHRETTVNGTYYFAPASGRLVRHSWTSEGYLSRPSGYVEAATQQTNSRVTIDLVSSPRE